MLGNEAGSIIDLMYVLHDCMSEYNLFFFSHLIYLIYLLQLFFYSQLNFQLVYNFEIHHTPSASMHVRIAKRAILNELVFSCSYKY